MKQRSSAGKILLIIIIVIVILLVATEFGLRWFIGNQVVQSVEASATESADGQQASREKATVAFGMSPLLLGLVQGEIPHVEVDTPSTLNIKKDSHSNVSEISGVPKTHLIADGLSLRDAENPTARTMTLETTLEDEYLLALVQYSIAQQQAMGQIDASQVNGQLQQLLQQVVQVTKVTSNPQNSTVDVEFTNGAASLTLRPKVVDGNLGFDATNTALFGFDLPEEATQAVSNSLNQNIADMNSSGMATDEVMVIDGGVRLKMSGNNVKLQSASQPINASQG
ncbi:MAG: DUF2993 domain-containing protein [Corynebacterium sp.]|nr:DUF2993 domain-containing protein [Corynebacterium sp.]